MKNVLISAIVVAAGAATGYAVDLPANPGPANNGGSPNWAMFFDLEAVAGPVTVTHMTTANTGGIGAAFSVEVFVRTGTALGGPVAAGPGSSTLGWTSIGIAPATQGATAGGVSLSIDIPDITVVPGGIVGVAVKFTTVGPRYFGTGTPPLSVYSDANLKLTTGEGRSAPFTPTGSFFTSRALVGGLTYTVGGAPCYADCDQIGGLTGNDFQCFLNAFVSSASYADCDGVGGLTGNDFQCFLDKFVAGCS